MNKNKTTNCGCGCCGGNAKDVLLGGDTNAPVGKKSGITRAGFLKTLAAGGLGLTTFSVLLKDAKASPGEKIIRKGGDVMIIDQKNREIRTSATVTKDPSKPSIIDWGRRFQAFFGSKGGKMEPYFVFTTEISRTEIDKAIQQLGIQSRRQIPMNEVARRKGLKATTTIADYLNGDPMICTIRFEKNDRIVEGAIEDFIMEKILVDGVDVIKPYTPHFVYHGTGEAIQFPSGCIVCPSDCNGGIITDNVMPLKTTENYYKVNWDRMPDVGSKVEVVLKSIYGPQPMKTIKG